MTKTKIKRPDRKLVYISPLTLNLTHKDFKL